MTNSRIYESLNYRAIFEFFFVLKIKAIDKYINIFNVTNYLFTQNALIYYKYSTGIHTHIHIDL